MPGTTALRSLQIASGGFFYSRKLQRHLRAEQRCQNGQCGVANLSPVLIGNPDIALEASARCLVAGSAVKKYALAATRRRFDRLAHRTDIVGGNQRVAPTKRNRMAGVVNERTENSPGRVGYAAD